MLVLVVCKRNEVPVPRSTEYAMPELHFLHRSFIPVLKLEKSINCRHCMFARVVKDRHCTVEMKINDVLAIRCSSFMQVLNYEDANRYRFLHFADTYNCRR